MKKTILLVLVTLISLPEWAAGAGRTNDTTLSKIFPVGKGEYYTITLTGANAHIIRTKGDQVKIDMMDTGRYEPKDEKVANYILNAEKTGNTLKVQVNSNATYGPTKGGSMHLVISIPRTIGFRLESKNNLIFGEGFSNLHGNYSGIVKMHAED